MGSSRVRIDCGTDVGNHVVERPVRMRGAFYDDFQILAVKPMTPCKKHPANPADRRDRLPVTMTDEDPR